MNPPFNTRTLSALAATALLAACNATTALETPTIPPSIPAGPTTEPIVLAPTVPATQPPATQPPGPQGNSRSTEAPVQTTTTTQVVVDDPDSQPPRVTPEPGVRHDRLSTPQLGPEPVRGSGCGADGSIGDVIPDGLWYGYVDRWAPPSMGFDLACVYYDDSAVPFRDACYDGSPSELDVCLNQELDFWMVNNNSRSRDVPISPTADIYNPGADGCPDQHVWDGFMPSLIQIHAGEVIYISWTCGGS